VARRYRQGSNRHATRLCPENRPESRGHHPGGACRWHRPSCRWHTRGPRC